MDVHSNWIWTSEWSGKCEKGPTAVLFRKEITLQAGAELATLKISADSRYKLYINGKLVEVGPCKGDSQIWFYDEIDISHYLVAGENCLAVIVLRFPLKPGEGNQSLIGTHTPGLFLTGFIRETGGKEYDISADETWRAALDERTHFVAEASGFAPLHFYEEVTETPEFWQWKWPEYDDNGWKPACPYPRAAIRDAVSPGNLNPRPIPYMRRQMGRFKEVLVLRRSVLDKDEWNQMLEGKRSIRIPGNSKEVIEIDAGEEMTGYLHLLLEQGAGATIHLLQSEAYVQPGVSGVEGNLYKADRLDFVKGVLEGYTDIYRPAGTGSEIQPEEYEPFWFRTFRFIRLEITTGIEDLVIRDFYFEETGYPLKVCSQVETSDSSLAEIWDISVRTIKRCMQETYTDCPFYEQLQYAMDSRAQILFTYCAAADDRLARQCMDDFKRGQRYDGLICSAYPNTRPNVIPDFSIFYILMVHDHMMYFGDRQLVRYHMSAVEQVLSFFERNRTETGYVGQVGGMYRQHRFWSFIDWVPEWQTGVPNAIREGALTMESLLYLLGLQKAAELARYIGREELAKEYLGIAAEVKQSLRTYCMDQNGWLLDGPGCYEYSQHCQVFGVLTGTLDVEQGRRNLEETLRHSEKYAQCTVSMALYLFRALELTGLYAYTDECWEIWRQMIKNHMTTVAESDANPRSECHAWGALALYELPSVVLGVRPAAPGYEKVEVKPVPGYLTWARGDVITPKGMIHVEWAKRENGKLDVEYKWHREEIR